MKSYTTTEALLEKIEQLKKDRKTQASWTHTDEQMLAFLTELHILRTTFMHTCYEYQGIADIISKLHDDMQDEKGLLVY